MSYTTSAWRCPNCKFIVTPDGERPRSDRRYQCSICLVTLVADPETGGLIVVPPSASVAPPDDNDGDPFA